MKYKYVLIDVDNTLLDFGYAEKNAHKMASEKFNIPWTDEFYNVYHQINDGWWKKLERGECTKEEIVVNRYKEYFAFLGVKDVEPQEFNKTYLSFLGLGKKTIDGANELVKALYDGGLKLYIATNGVTKVQSNRLSGQEFMKYISGVFVSEDLKATKPQKEFFINAEKSVGVSFKGQTIIIGDSLTSDMLGGVNAEIDTLWFNPKGKENTLGINLTYEVKSLSEIPSLILK